MTENKSRAQLIDNLTRAREVFRERGGAKNRYKDSHGRVCAIGAIAVTLGYENSFTEFGEAFPPPAETQYLFRAAQVLYPKMGTPVTVNDLGNPEMVMNLYDYAIKELENENS